MKRAPLREGLFHIGASLTHKQCVQLNIDARELSIWASDAGDMQRKGWSEMRMMSKDAGKVYCCCCMFKDTYSHPAVSNIQMLPFQIWVQFKSCWIQVYWETCLKNDEKLQIEKHTKYWHAMQACICCHLHLDKNMASVLVAHVSWAQFICSTKFSPPNKAMLKGI